MISFFVCFWSIREYMPNEDLMKIGMPALVWPMNGDQYEIVEIIVESDIELTQDRIESIHWVIADYLRWRSRGLLSVVFRKSFLQQTAQFHIQNG